MMDPKFPLCRYPQGAPKSQILTSNISKMVSRNVIRQMGLHIGSTAAFQKCITWDGSLQRSPLEKYAFLPWNRYLATIGVKICMRVQLCPVRSLGFSTFYSDIFRVFQGSQCFLNNFVFGVASVTSASYTTVHSCVTVRFTSGHRLRLHGVVVVVIVVGLRAIS